MIEVSHPALLVSSCAKCIRSGYPNSVGLDCVTPVRIFAITGCVTAPHVCTVAGYVPLSASSEVVNEPCALREARRSMSAAEVSARR
jgi:hypothetical protein